MSIGSKIKERREILGLTQEELGKACGTTKQTIFKYETGVVTNIPMDRLCLIAEKLNVTPSFLMGWDDSNETPEIQNYAQILKDNPKYRLLMKTAHELSEDDFNAVADYAERLRKSYRD
jgi:transcriptional regulator with XRE-family HTH domain